MAVNRWNILLIIVSICSIPYVLFTWYSYQERTADLHFPLDARAQPDTVLSFGSKIPSEFRRGVGLHKRDRKHWSTGEEKSSSGGNKLSGGKNLDELGGAATAQPTFAKPLKYRPVKTHVSDAAKDSGSSAGRDVATGIPIEPRVAVLIPYVGKVLPSWFDMFALSAKASSKMFDWLIFISEAPKREVPDNVKLIRLSLEEFYWRFAEIDAAYASREDSKSLLANYFRALLGTHPYMLVEMKPALGFLFRDYLEGYSHWAYADLDTIVGRIHLHLTASMLARHDLITFSFGDNFRLYLRGQLTIHKNNEYVSNLWRGCKHLSHMGDRMKEFFQPNGKWHFQSAEGCYSSVVVDDRNTSVLYMPLQFSDAFGAPIDQKESILLGDSILKCYVQPLNFSQRPDLERLMGRDSANALSLLDPSVSNNNNNNNRDGWFRSDAADSRLAVRLHRVPPRCSYWISPDFDVCVDFVPANASIVTDGGDISYYTDERYYVLGNCREASIAHFQGWKRSYYKYTTRLATADSHAVVVSDAGLIPLRLKHLGVKTHQEIMGVDTMKPGRISHTDLIEMIDYINSSTAASAPGQQQQQQENQSPYFYSETPHFHKIGRLMNGISPNSYGTGTFTNSSATSISANEFGGHGTSGVGGSMESTALSELLPQDIHATSYCAQFSADVKKCLCYVSGDDIAVVQIGEPMHCSSSSSNRRRKRSSNDGRNNKDSISKSTSENVGSIFEGGGKGGDESDDNVSCAPISEEDRTAATLISVGWVEDFYITKLFDPLLDSWRGPKLLVLARVCDVFEKGADSRPLYTPHRSDVTIVEVDITACYYDSHRGNPTAAAVGLGHSTSTSQISNLQDAVAAARATQRKHSNDAGAAASGSGRADSHEAQQDTAEFERPHLVLPDNTLYNIGLDAVGTAFVCLAPANTVFKTFSDVEERLRGNSDTENGSGIDGSKSSSNDVKPGKDNNAHETRDVDGNQGAVSAASLVQHIRSIEKLEQSELMKGTADGSPLPVALVVPAFTLIAAESSVSNAHVTTDAIVENNKRSDSDSSSSSSSRINVEESLGEENNLGDGSGITAAGYDYYPPIDPSLVGDMDCGGYQAEGLLITWEDAKSRNLQLVPFSARDLLTERSLMLPVIFNIHEGPHGSGFARFPEELNGPGCFGTSFLRVLAGSGYPLFWDTGYEFAEMTRSGRLSGTYALSRFAAAAATTESSGDSALSDGLANVKTALRGASADAQQQRSQQQEEEKKKQRQSIKDACHCSYNTDPNALRDMVAHINSYFLKAVLLRATGLNEIYSREQFGAKFERDQFKDNKANT